MSSVDLSGSYLLSQFRVFYGEVQRLREQVHSGAWVFQAEEADSEDAETTEQARQAGKSSQVNAVIGRLTTVLERQALDSTRLGGEYGAALYKEAQYVLAALADEIFLHDVDWDARQTWADSLIEARLFGTNVAGEAFYRRAEELLNRRDPVYAELALVYFLALGAGFRGKYRGRDDGGRIDLLKRQLYEFAFRRPPDLNSTNKLLFTDAYMHTLQQGTKQQLPHVRRWLFALAAVVLVLLGASHLVWMQATGELDRSVGSLLRWADEAATHRGGQS